MLRNGLVQVCIYAIASLIISLYFLSDFYFLSYFDKLKISYLFVVVVSTFSRTVVCPMINWMSIFFFSDYVVLWFSLTPAQRSWCKGNSGSIAPEIHSLNLWSDFCITFLVSWIISALNLPILYFEFHLEVLFTLNLKKNCAKPLADPLQILSQFEYSDSKKLSEYYKHCRINLYLEV